MSAIEVKRLSPEIADDFIAFFEGGVFNDNSREEGDFTTVRMTPG